MQRQIKLQAIDTEKAKIEFAALLPHLHPTIQKNIALSRHPLWWACSHGGNLTEDSSKLNPIRSDTTEELDFIAVSLFAAKLDYNNLFWLVIKLLPEETIRKFYARYYYYALSHNNATQLAKLSQLRTQHHINDYYNEVLIIAAHFHDWNIMKQMLSAGADPHYYCSQSLYLFDNEFITISGNILWELLRSKNGNAESFERITQELLTLEGNKFNFSILCDDHGEQHFFANFFKSHEKAELFLNPDELVLRLTVIAQWLSLANLTAEQKNNFFNAGEDKADGYPHKPWEHALAYVSHPAHSTPYNEQAVHILKWFCHQGAIIDPKKYGKDSFAPVHRAVMNNCLPVVIFLKDIGFRLDTQNYGDGIPLHTLCRNGWDSRIVTGFIAYRCEEDLERMFEYILEHTRNVDAANQIDETALMIAAGSLKAAYLQKLIARGAAIDHVALSGDTILHQLCHNPDDSQAILDLMKCVIESGISVDTQNKKGERPLGYTIAYEALNKFIFLLDHGASITLSRSESFNLTKFERMGMFVGPQYSAARHSLSQMRQYLNQLQRNTAPQNAITQALEERAKSIASSVSSTFKNLTTTDTAPTEHQPLLSRPQTRHYQGTSIPMADLSPRAKRSP